MVNAYTKRAISKAASIGFSKAAVSCLDARNTRARAGPSAKRLTRRLLVAAKIS